MYSVWFKLHKQINFYYNLKKWSLGLFSYASWKVPQRDQRDGQIELTERVLRKNEGERGGLRLTKWKSCLQIKIRFLGFWVACYTWLKIERPKRRMWRSINTPQQYATNWKEGVFLKLPISVFKLLNISSFFKSYQTH